jgi:hypothetical protein
MLIERARERGEPLPKPLMIEYADDEAVVAGA